MFCTNVFNKMGQCKDITYKYSVSIILINEKI